MSKQALAIVAAASVIGGLFVFFTQPSEHRPPAPAAVISATLRARDSAPPEPREAKARQDHPPSRPQFVDPSSATKPNLGVPSSETAVLDQLHDLGGEDPPLSMRLARAELERHPESPNAPELEWNVVKALYNMGRFDEARQEALTMVKSYPDSPFTSDVDRHLLHLLPNPD